MYLQTILKRPQQELIRRVYTAQKRDALPGDFYEQIQDDFKIIGKEYTEKYIQQMSKDSYKREIKARIQNSAFVYLKGLQSTHSKVKGIVYEKFETQKYMKCPLFKNEEVNLLHKLRSRSIAVKNNFSSKFKNNLLCPLC